MVWGEGYRRGLDDAAAMVFVSVELVRGGFTGGFGRKDFGVVGRTWCLGSDGGRWFRLDGGYGVWAMVFGRG